MRPCVARSSQPLLLEANTSVSHELQIVPCVYDISTCISCPNKHLMASELFSMVCYQGPHSARTEGLLHWAFKFSHKHLIFHDFLIVWLIGLHREVQVV